MTEQKRDIVQVLSEMQYRGEIDFFSVTLTDEEPIDLSNCECALDG